MSIIEQELARLTEEFNRMELRHEQLMRNLNDLLNNDSHDSYEEDIPDENYDHSENFDCEPHFDNQPNEFYYVNECNNADGESGQFQNSFCDQEQFYEHQCPLCGSDQFYGNEAPFHNSYDNNDYDDYSWYDNEHNDFYNNWDDGNDGYDNYDDQGDCYNQ